MDNKNLVGQVKNISCVVSGIDISRLIEEVTIFADVFTPSPVIELNVVDTTNFLETNEIKNFDSISLKVDQIILPVRIVNITDRTFLSQGVQTFKITCLSEELIKDFNTKDFSSFVNQDISSIAKLLGIKIDQETKPSNLITILGGGQSKISVLYKAIGQLLNGQDPDFLLFKPLTGNLKLISFSDAFDKHPVKTFSMYTGSTNRTTDHSNIKAVYVEDSNGVIQMVTSQKSTTTKKVDLYGDEESTETSNSGLKKDTVDSYSNSVRYVFGSSYTSEGSNNFTKAEVYSKRASIFSLINQNIVTIKVNTELELTNLLGSVVLLDIPNFKNKDKNKVTEKDKLLAGKGVVTAFKIQIAINTPTDMLLEISRGKDL